MPKFEIKKFRSQRGHEGPGYYCELWMDGKLAAHCYDDCNGGSPIVHYVSPQVRHRVLAHIKTMPPYHWEADEYNEAHDSPMDEELFLLQLEGQMLERFALLEQADHERVQSHLGLIGRNPVQV